MSSRYSGTAPHQPGCTGKIRGRREDKDSGVVFFAVFATASILSPYGEPTIDSRPLFLRRLLSQHHFSQKADMVACSVPNSFEERAPNSGELNT